MVVNMKKVISDAFTALIARKSIDKITVKDLVEECNISRQTFYYHFQDILEVLEWTTQERMQEALRESLAADSSEEALRCFLIASLDKADIVDRLLHSQKREFVEKLFLDNIETYLIEMIHSKAPEKYINISDTNVILHFLSGGIVNALMQAKPRTPADADKLARQLSQLLSGIYPD